MANRNRCTQGLMNTFHLAQKDAEALYKKVTQHRKEMQALGKTPAEALAAVKNEYQMNLVAKRARAIMTTDTIRALIKKADTRKAALEDIAGFKGYLIKAANTFTEVTGLRKMSYKMALVEDIFYGSNLAAKGIDGDISIARGSKALSDTVKTIIYKELGNDDLAVLSGLNKKNWDLKFERAMNDISDASTPKQITKIADAMKKAETYIKEERLNAGLPVNNGATRNRRSYHPFSKIAAMKEDAWIATLEGKLDTDFLDVDDVGDPVKVNNKLKEIYNKITTGSLEDRATATSALVFKDVESKLIYDSEMQPNRNAVLRRLNQLEQSAREISAAKALGPNYLDGLNQLFTDLNLDAATKLQYQLQFDLLLHGEKSNYVIDSFIGKGYNALNKTVNMAFLSTAPVNTLADVATTASILEGTVGINKIESFYKGLSNWATSSQRMIDFGNFGTKGAENVKAVSQIMGMHFRDELNSIVGNRFGADLIDAPTKGGSTLNKLHSGMFNVLGLERQSESMRLLAVKAVAGTLYDNADKSFGSLFKGTQELFRQFGITSDDWDVLRKAKVDLGGVGLISSEVLRDEKIFADAKVNSKYYTELSMKYKSALGFIADRSSPTPDARFHAYLATIDPNTIRGVATLAMFKFKGFSQAAVNTFVATANLGGVSLASSLMIESAIVGLGIYYTKQLLSGKSPDEIKFNREFIEKGFLAGGVLGFPAEMLLNRYGKGQGSLSADIAGPVAGVVQDVLSLGGSLHRGELTGNQVINTMKRYTPKVPFIGNMVNNMAYDATVKPFFKYMGVQGIR